MSVSIPEYQHLRELRENIRRGVQALELCWGCQDICECAACIVDDGPPVWLCDVCWQEVRVHRTENAEIGE